MINSSNLNKVEDLNYELVKLLEQEPLEGRNYYQISIFADKDGDFHTSFFSHWVGWADKACTQEIREPSLVLPKLAIKQFNLIKEPLLVLNNERDLAIYLLIFGGHALLEKDLGDKYLADYLQPAININTYDKGFVNVGAVPKEMFHKAPNPKLRMKILNRDNRRCKICGASPQNNEHVELHLHHIMPHAKGGLTNENNLITLCHTCHKGLEPHLDYSLFDIIGVKMLSDRLSRENYFLKLQRNVEASFAKHHRPKRKKNGS